MIRFACLREMNKLISFTLFHFFVSILLWSRDITYKNRKHPGTFQTREITYKGRSEHIKYLRRTPSSRDVMNQGAHWSKDVLNSRGPSDQGRNNIGPIVRGVNYRLWLVYSTVTCPLVGPHLALDLCLLHPGDQGQVPLYYLLCTTGSSLFIIIILIEQRYY
jgi:hypothetical protein